MTADDITSYLASSLLKFAVAVVTKKLGMTESLWAFILSYPLVPCLISYHGHGSLVSRLSTCVM
jgi:hypothetical protein